MNNRCINLDWLEVHALEPADEPHTADYFARCGYVVHLRDYGTRIYREMITLDGTDGEPLIEVRRDPKSTLHSPYETHIRLHNRTCYFDDAVTQLQRFLTVHRYEFARISRVDICCDFERFDSGDDPQRFLHRYLSGQYSKINQSNISAHGTDTWNAREWNSVSWGSPTSDIGTKFYNKTLELFDPTTKAYRKPYIRQAWLLSGLVDDMINVTRRGADGLSYVPQIWRVEFSIRSSVKKWFVIEKNGKHKAYQSICNTLDMYDSRVKLVTLFAALTQHYFHFKHYEEGKRKDRCRDKDLFKWTGEQFVYKVGKYSVASADKPDKPLMTLINKLREYLQRNKTDEVRQACNVILNALENDQLRHDLDTPFRRAEIIALQEVVARRNRGDNTDAAILLRQVKSLLKLNNATDIF